MQKVAKELLDRLRKGLYTLSSASVSKNSDVTKLATMQSLLEIRERELAMKLANSLQKGLSKGLSIFEVWMKQESDTIQAFSL